MALDEVVIKSPVSVKETPALGLDQVTDPRIRDHDADSVQAEQYHDSTGHQGLVGQRGSRGRREVARPQALVNANLPNVNFNGLKVQVLQMSCPEANTGPIVMTSGASNGYDIGGKLMLVSVSPGNTVIFLFLDNAPDVVGPDSELDFAGTGTETFDILMVAG